MSLARSSHPLAAHAVCVGAGLRDGLRTAQFFIRVLSGAQGWGKPAGVRGEPVQMNFLSRTVTRFAQFADSAMTAAVNLWISLTVPQWRKLPSPFTHGMMSEVMGAIRQASFAANPLFNAYFYRAAIHILRRFRNPPFLVLEHRVDTARRQLAQDAAGNAETETAFLARALSALVTAAPVARPGTARAARGHISGAEANLMVYATACVALLFAEEGKPVEELDEDQFFAIVSALISQRLPRIAKAIEAKDLPALEGELREIKAMY